MSHERAQVERYEPPRIEDRTEIALPLIAGPAVSPSASFRPASVGSYEPPGIEDRLEIDVPLIGTVSASAAFRSTLGDRPSADLGDGLPVTSAAFRPVSGEMYEPPRIEERAPIDLPLIGLTRSVSAAFRPEVDERYEPPPLEERTDIGLPLIGSRSPGLCAVFSSH